MDIRFFYYRDDTRRPLITLCRVCTGDGRTAYGWAICARKDQCHKDDVVYRDPDTGHEWREPGGRSRARGRALRALTQGLQCQGLGYESLPQIVRYARPVLRDEAREVMQACQAFGFRLLVDDGCVNELPPSMSPNMGGKPHAAPS
mgnify:CR=1 FL=1